MRQQDHAATQDLATKLIEVLHMPRAVKKRCTLVAKMRLCNSDVLQWKTVRFIKMTLEIGRRAEFIPAVSPFAEATVASYVTLDMP